MRVLVTGAFGNLGPRVLEELLQRGHEVTCFDVHTRRTEQSARPFRDRVRLIWGDIRNPKDVAGAVTHQDVVVHLAFIIPKLSATGRSSEDAPDWAREINVGGTRTLLDACAAQPVPPRIIFASSVHAYGPTQHLDPPRRADEELHPAEHYARHKVACEEMVRSSGLPWTILRFAAALPVAIELDPFMFDIPPENRMEFVHSKDVARAVAASVEERATIGRTLLIGGGPACQLRYRDIYNSVLETLGIGALPDEAFARKPFATDWFDTEESQRILDYQRHTFQDYLRDMRKAFGFRVHLFRLFRPLVRRWLLRRSRHWEHARYRREWEGKIALVTGATGGIGAATARLLGLRGLTVALTARSVEALDELVAEIQDAGGRALAIPADLTLEDERTRLMRAVRSTLGGLDVLVHCAGMGWYGYASEMPWNVARDMVRVNNEAATHLTLLALPEMRAEGAGHIVHLGSMVAHLPSQGVAVYAATKAYEHALASALYRELAKSGVCVSVVHPGPVRTGFFGRAGCQPHGMPVPAESLAISPERVAERIWGVLVRRSRVAFVPRLLGLTPWVELLFGWLIDLIGPALLRKRRPSEGVST